jgi:phospholipase C
MERRDFLRSSLAAAGGVALGGKSAINGLLGRPARPAHDRLLDLPAKESPIDTVVVAVMENRSFDHLLGWLANDRQYLAEGRRLHGKDFHVIGSIDEKYRAPNGKDHETIDLLKLRQSADPYRGCSFKGPGHTWDNGRAQRDHGFLAKGADNDDYAISYFNGEVFPHHRAIASHFQILDRYHASLLGPTFPNRQYVHSAQSEGRKDDPGPMKTGIYKAETIWDKLVKAGVPATYYYTDLPILRLWGERMKPLIAPLDQYFEQALAGTLPNFSMVDPSFTGPLRADGHPQGDVRLAVAFFAHVLGALLLSPQWERSMLVIIHDEWGGFYDHVRPPHLPDDRASSNDADDFSQAGFRAAAAVISPYAPPHSVDHTLYDHTSILRFLEWRFLGAPASGLGSKASQWGLTKRDRHATPIGQNLRSTPARTDFEDILIRPDPALGITAPCTSTVEDPFVRDPKFDEERARDHPEAKYRPWEPTKS